MAAPPKVDKPKDPLENLRADLGKYHKNLYEDMGYFFDDLIEYHDDNT